MRMSYAWSASETELPCLTPATSLTHYQAQRSCPRKAADPPGHMLSDALLFVLQVGELMGVPGLPEALVSILANGAGTSSPAAEPMDGASPAANNVARSSPEADAQLAADLLTEVSWVLAYVTAGAEAHLNRMVALGVVPPLSAHLVWCTQQVGKQHERTSVPQPGHWRL